MSISYALDTLTNPNPSERQHLVKFLAERCKLRAKNNFSPRIDDCWYIIAIALRWQAITGQEQPNLGRLALGKLAQDIFDTWTVLVQNEV